MRLTSGQSYRLSDLFTGPRLMVIPDLQRDYCWGKVKAKSGKPLAEEFCGDILLTRCRAEPVSLGLIYAYETPVGNINIADGQQRLTSLYLLLLAINRLAQFDSKNATNDFLFIEDAEPRLQFEIRGSTRHFLKGLVVNSSTTLTTSAIESAPWFRKSYQNDPTVVSMVAALNSFTKALEVLPMSDLEALAGFILGSTANGIRFIYFDVKDRSLGEKLYVIINSRGAPMEESEHIKPLLLGQLEDTESAEWSEQWEYWQDFFWQQKLPKESSGDGGFDDFLEWHVQIRETKEKPGVFEYYARVKTPELVLADLQYRFDAVKKLTSYLTDEDFQSVFCAINGKKLTHLRSLDPNDIRLVVLPMLVAIERSNCDRLGHYHLLCRLRRNRFDCQGGKWNYRKANSENWTELLNVNIPLASEPSAWRNAEETIKSWIKQVQGGARVIEELENHRDLQGDLWPIIRALSPEEKTPSEVANQLLSRPAPEVLHDIQQAYERFKTLEAGLIGETEADASSSNQYFLLMVQLGSFTIDKLHQVKHWGEFGKHGISIKGRTMAHLMTPIFWRLLGPEKGAKYLREEIKFFYETEFENRSPAAKTLLMWILFKVLSAGRVTRLAACDYLAACFNHQHNRLLPEQHGYLTNLYCGTAAMKSHEWGWPGQLDENVSLTSPLIQLNDIAIPQYWIQTLPRKTLDEQPNQDCVSRLGEADKKLRSELLAYFGGNVDTLVDQFLRHIDDDHADVSV